MLAIVAAVGEYRAATSELVAPPVSLDSWTTNPSTGLPMGNVDIISDMRVYVQGGKNGAQGLSGYNLNSAMDSTPANSYSGSFNYELSFLKKDHTLILDINKDVEMFDGIGEQGILLIPEHLDLEIRNNLDYYIQQISTLLGFGGASDDAINYDG